MPFSDDLDPDAHPGNFVFGKRRQFTSLRDADVSPYGRTTGLPGILEIETQDAPTLVISVA